MFSIQEYKLELKLENIVIGQGLCKLANENKYKELTNELGWEDELVVFTCEVLFTFSKEDSWYANMKHFFNHGSFHNHFTHKGRREFILKSPQYTLINDILSRRNHDGVLLIFLEKEDAHKVLKDLHDGLVGGHYARETTPEIFLRDGYYFHTLFKHAHTKK